MKKSVLKIIIIFILIIIEAVLTINFSVYTADIINNGLIKKGIDLSIPFFVDEDYMNMLEEYYDTNLELKNYYTLISKDDINTFRKYNVC